MKRIAVFCGSSIGFSQDYARDAVRLGEYFSAKGIGLVYGGGKIGIMGVLADTIHAFPSTSRILNGLFAEASRALG